MNSAIRSVGVMTGALAVLLGSVASSAQATVDAENRYPNVGAIMVWRVDESGKPVELKGVRKRHIDPAARDDYGRSLHRAREGTG